MPLPPRTETLHFAWLRRYFYLHFNACGCVTNVQHINVDKYNTYNTYNVPNKIAPAATPNRLSRATATYTHTTECHVAPSCKKAERNDLIYTNILQIADRLPKQIQVHGYVCHVCICVANALQICCKKTNTSRIEKRI